MTGPVMISVEFFIHVDADNAPDQDELPIVLLMLPWRERFERSDQKGYPIAILKIRLSLRHAELPKSMSLITQRSPSGR
jgi:hypothetical protein